MPPGHPEGYLEGFANLYAEAAQAIRSGTMPDTLPGIRDGLEGLQFIDACIRSNAADAAWVVVMSVSWALRPILSRSPAGHQAPVRRPTPG